MAIAFDNAASFTYVSGSPSTTFTMSATANGCIIVTGSSNLSSVTYGGQSMTLYTTFTPSIIDGNQQIVKVFTLFNPPTGSNTLTTSSSGDGTLGIASYTGVASASNPETFSTGFSNNGVNNTQVGTLATSVTTITDNSWSVMCARGGNNLQNFIAGSTLRTTGVFIFGNGTQGIYDSNGPITPAGSSTLTTTWASGSGFLSNVIFSLVPYVYTPIKGTMMII